MECLSKGARRGGIGQRAARSSKWAIISLASLNLAACSLWPLQQVTSLSPAVRADTVGYNNAAGDASDRILLTNVLRAKDLAPLDLGQLSSISGTLSLQGSLAFTLPFGHGLMGGNPMDAQNVVNPGVMGSTTPTYTFTPLNTQGFILSILQPVSASYVLTRWQAGVSRELLLMLFVKEIDFPLLSKDKDKITGKNKVTGTKRYINDPDNLERLTAFQNLVGTLLYAGAELKAIDILDPIGPPFSLYASVSKTDADKKGTTTSPETLSDQNGFSLITGSNDGQYHVGNADQEADAAKFQKEIRNGGQLYRVYSGQVELCADSTKMVKVGYSIPELTNDVLADNGLFNKAAAGGPFMSLPTGPTGSGGGATAGSGASGGAHGASGQPTPGAGSGSALTAALQAGRVSALVSSEGCYPDEYVLDSVTEDRFQEASERFVHIQWRSVSEIFDYLGAVLRYQANPKNKLPLRLVWTNESVQDSTIQYAQNLFDMPPPEGAAERQQHGSESMSSSILFAVYPDWLSDISASYDGESFAPKKVDPKDPTADYTMPILSMLSTLVDYASQPGTISTSAPLRLLPIP
jgi:hypothetical protein